jgi:hypothetical protein
MIRDSSSREIYADLLLEARHQKSVYEGIARFKKTGGQPRTESRFWERWTRADFKGWL